MTEQQRLAAVVLAFILIRLIYCDLRYRRIKDIDLGVLIVAVLCITPLTLDKLPYMTAAMVFAVGFGIWCLGICGAGDIKLVTILTLGVSQQWFLLCVMLMLLLGGVMAIGLLIYGKCFNHKEVLVQGVPYAIPIVISFGFGVVLTLLSA